MIRWKFNTEDTKNFQAEMDILAYRDLYFHTKDNGYFTKILWLQEYGSLDGYND